MWLYREGPGLVLAALCAIGLTSTPAPAEAQGGTASATMNGKVSDATGGALPGVTVIAKNLATNQPRTVVTNEEGRYTFGGLAPSRYSLQCELQGFATFVQTEITINVGSVVTIDVAMQVSGRSETITVTGEPPIVERGRTDLSTLITTGQIESLPTASRNFLDFTLLTPGTAEDISSTAQGVGMSVGGSRPKEASLLVDGFWNTDESFTFPRFQYSQDAIQEFQVVSLGGTAEFGRAIGGLVNAVTKSGTNAFRGSGYYFYRDTSLNAQDPLSKARNLPKAEFDRELFGGSVGGPLIRDRSFFFGALERTNQDTPQDNSITLATGAVIGLPAADVGALNLPLKSTFGMVKVTHRINDAHSFEAAYVNSQGLQTGAAFMPFVTRSRLNRLNTDDQSVQFASKSIAADGRWLHDLRLSYFPRDYTLDSPDVSGPPLTPEGELRSSNAPSVNITNVARFGGGRVSLQMYTKPFQAVYSSTISRSQHAIKFGVDYMFVRFTYASYGGPSSGTYNFGNLANYVAGRYTTYTQTFGDPLATWNHNYFAGYVQDSWVASDRLTLNLGLRYDVDWVSKYQGMDYGRDAINLGPRLAASYDLSGRGTTVLKFSNGLYYDRMFENPITSTYFRNAENLQSIAATWNFGQTGAPAYPATIPSDTLPGDAPPGVRNVYITPSKYRTPSSYQAGWPQSIMRSATISRPRSASSTTAGGTRRCCSTATCPSTNRHNASCGRIRPFAIMNQFSYEGKSEYTGLVVEARKRLSNRFFVNANATFARARDQGDNFNQQVSDVRFPEAEYGPSVDTPTFRFVANGSYDVLSMLSVSGVFRLRTGFAYDARAGATVDLNGDGTFDDRVTGIERNSFRMPGDHSLDLRLAWKVPLGGNRGRRVELNLDAFNLYNRDNVKTVNATWGANPATPLTSFGVPTSYFNPREIQLGVRVVF